MMKSLPDTLRKNGFTYTLVLREGDLCIYEQGVAENLKYFEVFKVKKTTAKVFKGKLREAHERMPSNEDFGKIAWTCRTLEDAMKRFNALRKNELSKNSSNHTEEQ